MERPVTLKQPWGSPLPPFRGIDHGQRIYTLGEAGNIIAMTLDFAFSESIGSLITDGKHPPIHALACPLQVKCIYKRSASQPAIKLLNA